MSVLILLAVPGLLMFLVLVLGVGSWLERWAVPPESVAPRPAPPRPRSAPTG